MATGMIRVKIGDGDAEFGIKHCLFNHKLQRLEERTDFGDLLTPSPIF